MCSILYSASLRFQPTKRPQLAAQKAKAKAIANKLASLSKPAQPVEQAEVKSEPRPDEASNTETKSNVADWKATLSEDEDANAYLASTRQRGGRKKRKKNKDAPQAIEQDWDDIYDPSRPNSYEGYKHSEEKVREVREWKDLLYRHRMQKRSSSQSDSDRSLDVKRNRMALPMELKSAQLTLTEQFAPPSGMSFAPPPLQTDSIPPPPPPPNDDNDTYIPPPQPSYVLNDASGDDAFARRMAMSNSQNPPPPPPTQQPVQALAGQISRAPVRYSLPAANPDLPANEAELKQMQSEAQEAEDEDDAPRSSRPGQAKFAERLMAKYGWSKGQGLGKEGTGVTTALYAKADKRKKKSDAEGGGFVTPSTIGRILGGTKSKAAIDAEESRFGAMSEVVQLEGMLNGMDVQAELARSDGNIMQEIGEECSEKYGNVERVYIHSNTTNENGALVLVNFTSQLSALRAVNALEGRVFDGNAIKARFWSKELFDQGQYE